MGEERVTTQTLNTLVPAPFNWERLMWRTGDLRRRWVVETRVKELDVDFMRALRDFTFNVLRGTSTT
jgi:hypothetical protein